MDYLPIVKIGNPVLRMKAEIVAKDQIQEPRFQDFLQIMIRTMHRAQGVGLAANQVARSIQAIVLECNSNERYPGKSSVPLQVFMNPKIISYSKELETDWEGCLSIPGYRGQVPRAREVTFEALDIKGNEVKLTVSGFHARIIQHEIDHINGFFYIDRMKDFQSWMHLDEINNLNAARNRDEG